MQAAGHFLVGPETPLVLFCPTFVSGLDAEQLQIIMREDQGIVECDCISREIDIASFEEAKRS